MNMVQGFDVRDKDVVTTGNTVVVFDDREKAYLAKVQEKKDAVLFLRKCASDKQAYEHEKLNSIANLVESLSVDWYDILKV